MGYFHRADHCVVCGPQLRRPTRNRYAFCPTIIDSCPRSDLFPGVTKSYTFPLSDKNGQAIAEDSTLKILVKFISTGVEEKVDDLGPILVGAELSVQDASEALGQLEGTKIPDFSLKESTSGSAVVGTGGDVDSILSKIGMIADIMDQLTEVRSEVNLMCTPSQIGGVDLSLRRGGLEYPGAHTGGESCPHVISVAILLPYPVGY